MVIEAVCDVMEEEPLGSRTGIGWQEVSGRLCCFWNFVLITSPSAPPSIRTRAGNPPTLQLNVSNCRSASARENEQRCNPLRLRRLFLSGLGGGVVDTSGAGRSRSGPSEDLDTGWDESTRVWVWSSKGARVGGE